MRSENPSGSPPKIGERLRNRVSIKPLTGHPNGYKWRATFIEGGKRKQKYFKTKTAAEAWREDWEDEAQENGTSHRLTVAERGAVIDTREKLAALGLDLRTALDHAIDYFQQSQRSATVSELIAEVIAEARSSDCSSEHISDLYTKLGKFEEGFGVRSVATITQDEIRLWLDSLKLEATSINSYRSKLVSLFSSAVRRSYVHDNVATKVRPKKIKEAKFSAISRDEAAALLASADERSLPSIAIGLFAGVRTCELKKLDWKAVDLLGDEESPHGYIRIEAAIAKSSRNRLIPIAGNLAAFLVLHTKPSGKVWPVNGRKLMVAVRRKVGFGKAGAETPEEDEKGITLKPWPRNALRHSYASYHLAHFKNAHALALNMGHTNTDIIFKHYRKLVSATEAANYWAIKPGHLGSVVSPAGKNSEKGV